MARKIVLWLVGLLAVGIAVWVGALVAANAGIDYAIPQWINRAASMDRQPIKTSMISLIADPGRYDHQRIRTIGYLHLEFEGDELCPTQEVYKIGDYQSCVWIDATPEMAVLSDHYVIVEGVFSSSRRGHMGAFSGTLQKVTRADVWSHVRQ